MADINSSVSNDLLDAILAVVMAQLVIWMPFLGWPVISTIVYYFLSKVGQLIFDQLSLFIDFTKIDFKVDDQNKKYQEALDALKKANEAGTEAEIEKAKSDFKDTLRNLIKLN